MIGSDILLLFHNIDNITLIPMIKIKRLTVITALLLEFGGVSSLLQAQNIQTKNSAVISNDSSLVHSKLPAEWNLQNCIDYALQNNIQIRKDRITAASSEVDLKKAKAALFPDLTFSTSHDLVNRPYQESSSYVSGSEVLSSTSKTTYSGSFGLNASYTLFNGGKRSKTIKQNYLDKQISDLGVNESENEIKESITKIYVQILYAAESVTINSSTLKVSQAEYNRGEELFKAGSLAKADVAQLKSEVSSNKYELVTSQATLANYELQLKQLLELDGEEKMNLYIPTLNTDNVLLPLPNKADVYLAALAERPEIQSGKLNIKASKLGISIAKAAYAPTISLSGGVGTTTASGSDYSYAQQMKNSLRNTIGLSLSLPIFDNRSNKSAVEKAQLSYQTSQLDLLDDQKTLYKTIESLWLDANSAQQQFAAADEKLKSTQTSYDLVSEQFNLGMKNTVDLLTEKNNLLQAKQEQLQAKYMAILNIQLLKFYRGEKISL